MRRHPCLPRFRRPDKSCIADSVADFLASFVDGSYGEIKTVSLGGPAGGTPALLRLTGNLEVIVNPQSVPQQYPSAAFVILVADLSGFARSFRSKTDEEMAAVLDRYYGLAESAISEAGGKIVKFMGDSVLARFVPENAGRAVASAVMLSAQVEKLAAAEGMSMSLGANLHLGTAVETELGKGPSRRLDIVGRAVNQAFLLGKGPGIRISEPVYRKLPSGDRTPWEKNRPPAVYVLGSGSQPYDGLGKTPNENAIRW